MASSLALKRLVSSGIVSNTGRFIRPAVASPSASRLFNTNAARRYDDDEDDREIDVDRRRYFRPASRNASLYDLFDSFFWPTRSVNQLLNMADMPSSGIGVRRGWDARETEDAVSFRLELPGLGKEDVKVSVEQNRLIIKGEASKESEEEGEGRNFTSTVVLPEKIFKTDQIKAEMKNGVLKVVVPKVKEEERTNVFNVKVE